MAGSVCLAGVHLPLQAGGVLGLIIMGMASWADCRGQQRGRLVAGLWTITCTWREARGLPALKAGSFSGLVVLGMQQ